MYSILYLAFGIYCSVFVYMIKLIKLLLDSIFRQLHWYAFKMGNAIFQSTEEKTWWNGWERSSTSGKTVYIYWMVKIWFTTVVITLIVKYLDLVFSYIFIIVYQYNLMYNTIPHTLVILFGLFNINYGCILPIGTLMLNCMHLGSVWMTNLIRNFY